MPASVRSENTTPKPKVSCARLRSNTSTSMEGSARRSKVARNSPPGPPPTTATRISGLRHADVATLAHALDPGDQHAARRQIAGRGAGVSHPAGGAGGDQVAGDQGDDPGDVGDQRR